MRKPYWVNDEELFDQLKKVGSEKPYVVAIWLGTSSVTRAYRDPDLILGADRIPSNDELVEIAVENLAPEAVARVLSAPRLEGVCLRFASSYRVQPILEERGPSDVGWTRITSDDDLFAAWRAELVEEVCNIEPGDRERLWTTMFEAFQKMPGRSS